MIAYLNILKFQFKFENYSLDLDRNWLMLKNRKAMGKPTLQRIRKKSKNPKMEEVESLGDRPDHVQVYRNGNNIHAEIKLPKVDSISQGLKSDN